MLEKTRGFGMTLGEASLTTERAEKIRRGRCQIS